MKTERIKAAVDETADEIHAAVDDAEDTIDDSVESIGERLAQARECLMEQTDRLIDSAKEISAAASQYAHARPIAAAGIAFAAGIVVARLLRR